jgi:RNA polymerase sigma factor (sigma-70 family)
MAPLLSTPLLRTQSDRRLTALAADGHDRAFEAIVERYRRPLERYLRRLLSEPLAEDVLQATFVRAWQALRAGTDVRDLRPWLYRIAHNQALNTLRAAGSALPAAAAELPAISLEAEIERREDLRAALHGIEALPDRQRAALVAIAVADRPHADVARELGMSDGALRQLLLRARTTLRAAATALTPYPLMSWLAGGQEATAARVAETAVGAGGAGVALKAGVAALAAGAVVAGGPALRGDHQPAPAKAKSAAGERHRQPATERVAFTGPAPTADHLAGDQGGAAVDQAAHAPATAGSSGGHAGRGHGSKTAHRSGSGASGSGGSGSGGSGKTSGSEGSESGGSGSGSGGSDESGSSGPGSESGESSGKGSSGRSGSGDDDRGGEHSGKGASGTSSSGKGSPGTGEATVAAPAPAAPVGGDDGTDAPTVAVAPPSNSGEGSDSGSRSGSGGPGSSGPGSGDSGGD